MNKEEIVNLLISDLLNEYTHMLFYLQSSFLVKGLHREELKEFLEKSARSEMEHIKQFADLIVGLGYTPVVGHHPIPSLTCPKQIIEHAIMLEQTVVNNYHIRMKQCDRIRMKECNEADDVDFKRISLFLEDQFLDSSNDLDHLKQMLV